MTALIEAHDSPCIIVRLKFQRTQPRCHPRRPPSPKLYAPRARVKPRNPDPYDGLGSSKLHPLHSQCKSVFKGRPEDFEEDGVKIAYKLLWLNGAAQRWYEPNLALKDHKLPELALVWGWGAFK